MRFEEFELLVSPGITEVIVPKVAHKMDEGWEPEMDDMVGFPLLVKYKNKHYVTLEHPDGTEYSFGYKYIELAQTRKVAITLNKYNLLIDERINTNFLKLAILNADRNILAKIEGLNIDNTYVNITEEILQEIQDKCPRVIGALLSNNVLELVN